ncbi:phosphoglycerate mutase [Mycolicibacter engbaekii]|uniref:Phosphoglycerate mutase n=1 Tax=Mycolicibacter engbaekii TaxID=188915 RepID=A0A1X1T4V9_9MYCO|nr:histidine phosphatase family protein [Mycolicibacter engbaekii]ORV39577.1 phosphoglycerate mutase [Mycolicibacter engbaekii]
MRRGGTRQWSAGVLAGAVLVGCASATAPPPAAAAVPAGIALAAAAEQITLDLVRHGQSTDDFLGILGTLPPGAGLTETGLQQADAVAQAILASFPDGISGVYASELLRTQQTAEPLAEALGMQMQVLSGLNEIDAGIWEGQPRDLLTQIGYFAPMAAWVLGLVLVPQLGSAATPNGVVFDERVTGAIDTIYQNTIAGDGPLTSVAYSSGGPIAIWALMNVENPPFLLLLQQLLETLGPPPNAGQAILQGSPADGWTMVSWNGTPVPATPDLLTGLFVDFRELIVAPQVAAWHIWEAIEGGDPADITAALQTGFTDVLAAFEAFPQAVLDTIAGALGGDTAVAAEPFDALSTSFMGAI